MATFMDAAFAQKDRLPARSQSIANHLPFLKTDRSAHQESPEIIGGDRCLFARAEDAGLQDHALGGGIEAVAVAVRAKSRSTADDGITALADLVT